MRWLAVVLVLFLVVDTSLCQVSSAVQLGKSDRGEVLLPVGMNKQKRLQALAGLIGRVEPLQKIVSTFSSSPDYAIGVISALNGTYISSVAQQVTGLDPQMMLQTKIEADPGFLTLNSQYYLMTIGVLAAILSVVAISTPKMVVDMLNFLSRKPTVEQRINLEELPPAVANWPEWADVTFTHSARGPHTVSESTFANVVRKHCSNLGLKISNRDVQKMILLLPEKAFVTDAVLNVIKTAIAVRLAKTSLPIQNLDQLFGSRAGFAADHRISSEPMKKVAILKNLKKLDARFENFLTPLVTKFDKDSVVDSDFSQFLGKVVGVLENFAKLHAREVFLRHDDHCKSYEVGDELNLCSSIDKSFESQIINKSIGTSKEITMLLDTLIKALRYNIKVIQKVLSPAVADSLTDVDVVSPEDISTLAQHRKENKASQTIMVEQRIWNRHLLSVVMATILVFAMTALFLTPTIKNNDSASFCDVDRLTVPPLQVVRESPTSVSVEFNPNRDACDSILITSYNLQFEPLGEAKVKKLDAAAVRISNLNPSETYTFWLVANLADDSVLAKQGVPVVLQPEKQ